MGAVGTVAQTEMAAHQMERNKEIMKLCFGYKLVVFYC